MGDFCPAGRTPGCPKIEYNRLAPLLAKGKGFTVQRGQGKVGGAIAHSRGFGDAGCFRHALDRFARFKNPGAPEKQNA